MFFLYSVMVSQLAGSVIVGQMFKKSDIKGNCSPSENMYFLISLNWILALSDQTAK